MKDIICIQIPNELKQQFQKDKPLLEEIPDLNDKIETIEQCINQGDVAAIAKLLDNAAYKIINERIYAIAFYQDFSQWYDYVISQLVQMIHVDFSDALKRLDVYTALNNCDDVLREQESRIDTNLLITKAIERTMKEKDNVDDNFQMKDICTFFIHLSKQNVHELVDTSYQAYIEYKILNNKIDARIQNIHKF